MAEAKRPSKTTKGRRQVRVPGPQPDESGAGTDRAEFVQALFGALEDLKGDGEELGGAPLDFGLDNDDGVRTCVRNLQRTYPPPHQLPGKAQALWRRLEGMIDEKFRRAGEPRVEWESWATVVDDLLVWLATNYELNPPTGTCDPGEWNARIQFDDVNCLVRIPGLSLERKVTSTQLRFLRALVEDGKAGKDYVSMETYAERLFGKPSKRRIQALRSKLPEEIKKLIVSMPGYGKGIGLTLPPPVRV